MTDIYQLDEVFNEATVPGITYVPPAEARQFKASIRTKGKHITLVGASGSGKSTVADKVIEECFPGPEEVHKFSGRQYPEEQSILSVFGKEFFEEPTEASILPWLQSFNLVVIDDVHHLTFEARHELAHLMKLWHEQNVKLLLIGIAKSSDEIVGSDPELAIRNDVHTLASQSQAFLLKVLMKGQEALNIEFARGYMEKATAAAKGLPAILQAIARITCIECDVEQTQQESKVVDAELQDIGGTVVKMFDPRYFTKLVGLAQGRRHARSVHSTFFDIVDSVARSSKMQISKAELYRKIVGSIDDPDLKKRKSTSFYRAMGTLQKAIDERGLNDILIYESDVLTIDDPVFRFYLDHVNFDRVRTLVKIRLDEYEWDVAISFAGEDRPDIEALVQSLEERGIDVFYDLNESARLWGKDLEVELAQIYANEAKLMVVCLSAHYPIKDWTRFELEAGRRAATKRLGDYLLPLRLSKDVPAMLGLRESIGYQEMLNPDDAEKIAILLEKKLSEEAK